MWLYCLLACLFKLEHHYIQYKLLNWVGMYLQEFPDSGNPSMLSATCKAYLRVSLQNSNKKRKIRQNISFFFFFSLLLGGITVKVILTDESCSRVLSKCGLRFFCATSKEHRQIQLLAICHHMHLNFTESRQEILQLGFCNPAGEVF